LTVSSMTFYSQMPDASHSALEHRQATGSRGRLELEFLRDARGITRLGRQYSSYPFHICRPFHLDDGPSEGLATVYTQSCSGGLYGLDRLFTNASVRERAQVHLTTQASTVVHRATDGVTEQSSGIIAGEEALVELFPDTTILFPGANLKSSVRLSLADTANAIIFDSFLAHDYNGEDRVFDLYENTITLSRLDGEPIAIDRFRVTGNEFKSGGVGVAGGYVCHGSVLAATSGVDVESLVGRLRSSVNATGQCTIGFSRLPRRSGFTARVLASDAVPMRAALLAIWRQFRLAVVGREPRPRRK